MTRADLDSSGMESKRLRVERSSSSRRLSSRSFSSWAIPDVNLYHKGAGYFAKDWFSAVPIEMKAMSRIDFLGYVAERQLRPAVIARKISCGNKTKKGARTWQILTSLAATCAQRATSFIADLARAAPLQGR